MVGVMFNEFQDPVTKTLLKTTETKEYLNLCSYELKRTIENDHQLKEYFFQALSNSSWANFGYLVAFDNTTLRNKFSLQYQYLSV